MLMPGVDGAETLERIRQIDRGVPVIMLTAVMHEEIARESLRKGALDYITKPVDFAYLELSILAALARRGA